MSSISWRSGWQGHACDCDIRPTCGTDVSLRFCAYMQIHELLPDIRLMLRLRPQLMLLDVYHACRSMTCGYKTDSRSYCAAGGRPRPRTRRSARRRGRRPSPAPGCAAPTARVGHNTVRTSIFEAQAVDCTRPLSPIASGIPFTLSPSRPLMRCSQLHQAAPNRQPQPSYA